jgi:hypothetical protein
LVRVTWHSDANAASSKNLAFGLDGSLDDTFTRQRKIDEREWRHEHHSGRVVKHRWRLRRSINGEVERPHLGPAGRRVDMNCDAFWPIVDVAQVTPN